jgi:hypothetical protein
MAKQDIVIGVAAGVAIAALVPLAIFIAVEDKKPLMRALARGGQLLSEKTHETFAEFQEIAEDLLAEMRTPHAASAAAAVAAAPGGSPSSPPETAPPTSLGADVSTAA